MYFCDWLLRENRGFYSSNQSLSKAVTGNHTTPDKVTINPSTYKDLEVFSAEHNPSGQRKCIIIPGPMNIKDLEVGKGIKYERYGDGVIKAVDFDDYLPVITIDFNGKLIKQHFTSWFQKFYQIE